MTVDRSPGFAAVLAMTVADGSSEGTVNLTDATAQTIDVGFGFDADRDRFDFDHARFASFGEDQTQPTQGTDDMPLSFRKTYS